MKFSIIIPTYRRESSLRRCLEALCPQASEGPWEVIVVNDGGPDLEECLRPFRSQLQLQLLQQTNAGPACARNRGAQLAQGDRLVFLDDDCCPFPDWHRRLRVAALQHCSALIGGRTVNSLQHNLFASTSQLLIDFLYEYYGRDGGKEGRFFTSNNLSLPRQDFLELGGFDEEFCRAAGEDREFCGRWIWSQRPVYYDPTVCIGHAHAMGLVGFVRQHLAYGQAARRYWALRQARGDKGRRFEPIGFYTELLTYALRRQGLSLTGLLQSKLLVLAQLSNALGYFSPMPSRRADQDSARQS